MDDRTGGLLRQRRDVLKAALALAPWLISSARAEDDPAAAPPQVGDHLVFLVGPKKDAPIRSDDLELGGAQAQAYPADPNGLIRNGTRLNLVIVARVGDEGLSDETRARSADGVVAYSGVCTHQACPVNMWSDDLKAFVCSCHGSVYNPKNGAEVEFGPAPRQLPALPLKSEGGLLTVAGGFTGRVGMTPNQ
jgi:rieske iron-sulfur protein